MVEQVRSNPDTGRDEEDETESKRRASGAHKLEDAEYAKRVWSWFQKAKEKGDQYRDQEREDHAFSAGHQWTEEQRERMRKESRPALTLNFVLPMVNAVCGEERLNRHEIKVYGRSEEDEPGSHAMSELIRWVMDENYGEYAVSAAFRHCVIGGRGWLHVRVDHLDDPQGKIVVERVKPWEMHIDPVSEMTDISDARYLIREKWLTEDEVEAMWPDKLEDLKANKEASQPEGIQQESTPLKDAYRGSEKNKVYDSQTEQWRVFEVWHNEVIPGAIALNPQDGQIEELTRDELQALLKEQEEKEAAFQLEYAQWEQAAAQAQLMGQMLPQPPQKPEPLQYVERPIKVFYYGFIAGDTVLERDRAPVRKLKRFPYVPIFGLYDEEKECWYGVVRPIKDPQRQHNVEQSAILHWTQTTPKTGWVGPKGSFVDRQRWEKYASQPGFIGEYNPTRGKPEQIRPPTIPRHVVELASTRLQTMRDISGINQEMMGGGTKETAGIVMEQRRKQATTILETLFDNLRLARKILGDVLIAYIQEFIADGRKVRVLGNSPEDLQYVQATQDLSFRTYDAVIEQTPNSENDRMATMHILQTTLPMLTKAGIPVPPAIIDTLPIPPHVKSEWKQLMSATMFGGAPMGGGPGAPPAEGKAAEGGKGPMNAPQEGPQAEGGTT